MGFRNIEEWDKRRDYSITSTYSITASIAAVLTQIERAIGFLEAATLSEQWIKAMSDRALRLEAHHTY